LTHPHADINPAPTRARRFHIHEMRRIPVIVTAKAKEVLDLSSHQSRVLPQALSEFFGTHAGVRRIEIDLDETGRLSIHVRHAKDGRKHHQFFMEVGDLTQTSTKPGQGFEATRTVSMLLELYRAQIGEKGS